MPSKLIAENRGSAGYLVLNAPLRRNALSLDMWLGIPQIIDRFEQDGGVRSIVVTGSGHEAFAAGADISEFNDHRATESSAKAYDEATQAAVGSIVRCTKPVIAAIRGICFGGGMALAMACDLRLASDDARFCIPAAKLGIGYGYEGTAALVSRLGPALAAEMLFTARVYTAPEAQTNGILHAHAAPADFDALVHQYTTMIAANAPLSMATAKLVIRAIASGDPAERRAAEDRIAACMTSADYAEGRTAFLEKRKPRFHGS
ncbi:MAG: enoyl-CoA hydratase/isomerase family protein [Alphaproteobacteria bacterium]|nr:enoyl-CoA hydratase/isomerase family protein [Alphaproteobacteria bacterium]